MKRDGRDFRCVFGFTFAQHWKGKKFQTWTVIAAALCFLLPALIMPLVEHLDNGGAAIPEGTGDEFVPELEQVYVVDSTGSGEVDWSFLNLIAEEGHFSALIYRSFGSDAEAAYEAANVEGGKILMLHITESEGVTTAQILLPEDSALTEADVAAYEGFLWQNFPYVLGAKLGLTAERVTELTAGINIEIAEHSGGVLTAPEEDVPVEEVLPQEQTRRMLAMILPYFNIMILYFMVLFYGQSVANSVILEKTSKLVDTFLVTVRPSALVMGKLLAIACSGALQLLLWLVSLLGGFAVGGMLVRAISPDTQMGLVLMMDQMELWSGVFSLPGVLLSVLILMGGFLLYCSLAAIGGAMASKPEELSSTNSLFSMVLVISFFCTLYAGGMGAGMSSSAAWLNWVPFTAILVAPSRILTGELSLLGAVGSLTLVLLASFLLVLLAGKVYRMLILYKGKVPKLGDVLKMLGNRS